MWRRNGKQNETFEIFFKLNLNAIKKVLIEILNKFCVTRVGERIETYLYQLYDVQRKKERQTKKSKKFRQLTVSQHTKHKLFNKNS